MISVQYAIFPLSPCPHRKGLETLSNPAHTGRVETLSCPAHTGRVWKPSHTLPTQEESGNPLHTAHTGRVWKPSAPCPHRKSLETLCNLPTQEESGNQTVNRKQSHSPIFAPTIHNDQLCI